MNLITLKVIWSIFQPAIDISDYTLEQEKKDIIEFINKE